MATNKAEVVNEVPAYVETRGIFESIRMMFSSVADVMIHTTGAIGHGAKAMDELALTGLDMAESNRRLMSIKVAGKEQVELARLQEQFPSLN